MSAVDIAAIREDIVMAARSGEMARHVALDHGTELCDEIEKLRGQLALVVKHIDQRPEYITALKNTRGDDNQADYWRWSGHSEARRLLAADLDWTVPHNPGEKTTVSTQGAHDDEN